MKTQLALPRGQELIYGSDANIYNLQIRGSFAIDSEKYRRSRFNNTAATKTTLKKR
jgi:hypothetical protein